MDTTSVLGSGTPNQSVSAVASNRSKMTQKDFFKVLTAQLTQQDPMKPMDSQDFLAQLVQLQNLQVTSDLSSNFAGLTSQNAFTSGASLLGKFVRGTDATGSEAVGMVRSVSIEAGKVQLLVGNTPMKLENVSEIVDPATLSGAPQ